MHPLPSSHAKFDEFGTAPRASMPSHQSRLPAVKRQTTCWIIGATSGIGAAVARTLASPERALVISGRRADRLAAMADEVGRLGGLAEALPMDVSDPALVDAAVERFPGGIDRVDELVFCAGLNVGRRLWNNLDISEFDLVVSTNFSAVARCIARVLPSMAAAKYGRFVIVSSWAGWAHLRGAGVAYSASKTALKPLTESVNEQHGPDGVSACLLCPGDVNTPLIDRRPTVPTQDERALMLAADDVARAVSFVLDLPRSVAVNELVMSPTHSHAYGR